MYENGFLYILRDIYVSQLQQIESKKLRGVNKKLGVPFGQYSRFLSCT